MRWGELEGVSRPGEVGVCCLKLTGRKTEDLGLWSAAKEEGRAKKLNVKNDSSLLEVAAYIIIRCNIVSVLLPRQISVLRCEFEYVMQ